MSSSIQPVKAKLRVILMADAVTVAEVEKPSLWQRILSEIQDPGTSVLEQSKPLAVGLTPETFEVRTEPQEAPDPTYARGRRDRFDNRAPYLTLEVHCWEKMKKQLATTGGTAIAALAVAGTLLAL